jgi:hypothetical protein
MMVNVRNEFGDFCADGAIATSFLKDRVYPRLNAGEVVTFDFDGVRNMNSSFSNALFGNLFRKYGEEGIKRIKVKNQSTSLTSLIKSSINYGLQQSQRNT